MLIALSGGSDSVALTLLLRELSRLMRFEVTGLAHVHHQLRETGDRDEAFCREFAARLGLPILTPRVDVKTYADTRDLSIEDAARRLRYQSLEQAAVELAATRIAVGHTVDDQAETFVLKLVRGAGTTGLGAIYPSRRQIVRPLLETSRAELRQYLTSAGQAWVEDETNADLSNPRNRVRHQVLPYLEEALKLPVRQAIARAAGLAGEDARWLDELAAERLPTLMVETPVGLELDAEALRSAPRPVARRVLLRALRMRANGKEVVMEHVQAAMDVLTGLAGAAEAPGSRVELRGEKLVLLQ